MARMEGEELCCIVVEDEERPRVLGAVDHPGEVAILAPTGKFAFD